MRVLLNTVSLDVGGGVANYYSVVRPFLSEGIEYFTVGGRGEKGTLAVIVRLLKDYLDFLLKLRNGNYDLVHLNPSLLSKAIVRDGIFLLIAKAVGKKVIVFVHGWDTEFERVLRQYFFGLFRITYLKADAFIVLSTEFREKLFDVGYRNLVFTETTAVDEAIFIRTDEEIAKSMKPPQNGGFNILFLSRVEREKGVYEAIDAFVTINSRHHSVTMTIAGDGGELSNARAYVLSRGIEGVEFSGYIRGEAKNSVFSRADVYLFPTYGEGMPISVLEAMAYGLPVITRPVGGIKDFFVDGEMGYITESLDPCVFAALLERLITDPEICRRMSKFNRQYAYDHFRVSQVAGRLLKIYGDVIGSA